MARIGRRTSAIMASMRLVSPSAMSATFSASSFTRSAIGVVAGREVLLIEQQHVQVTACGALIRGDLARDGVSRDVRERLRWLGDVLKKNHRPLLAVFDDLDLVLFDVLDRTALLVRDADVEADQFDAGLERGSGRR